MSSRRGFLGKLLGLAAAPLAKKVQVPQGGKLVDDGTLLQPIHNVARYPPQNIGSLAEEGAFPLIAPQSIVYLAQAPGFAIYNPTDHAMLLDVKESPRVWDIERAHLLAIQEDRSREIYKKNLVHDDWLYPVDPEDEEY